VTQEPVPADTNVDVVGVVVGVVTLLSRRTEVEKSNNEGVLVLKISKHGRLLMLFFLNQTLSCSSAIRANNFWRSSSKLDF
jgi:hypothetical protein